MADVQKCIPTIGEPVKKWNQLGSALLVDYRGGCECRLTAEMGSDLFKTLNKSELNTFIVNP